MIRNAIAKRGDDQHHPLADDPACGLGGLRPAAARGVLGLDRLDLRRVVAASRVGSRVGVRVGVDVVARRRGRATGAPGVDRLGGHARRLPGQRRRVRLAAGGGGIRARKIGTRKIGPRKIGLREIGPRGFGLTVEAHGVGSKAHILPCRHGGPGVGGRGAPLERCRPLTGSGPGCAGRRPRRPHGHSPVPPPSPGAPGWSSSRSRKAAPLTGEDDLVAAVGQRARRVLAGGSDHPRRPRERVAA